MTEASPLVKDVSFTAQPQLAQARSQPAKRLGLGPQTPRDRCPKRPENVTGRQIPGDGYVSREQYYFQI